MSRPAPGSPQLLERQPFHGHDHPFSLRISHVARLLNAAKIDALGSKIDSKFDALSDLKSQLLIRMDKSEMRVDAQLRVKQ